MNIRIFFYSKHINLIGDLMNFLKNFGVSCIYIFSIFFVLTFLITFLNYFDILNTKIMALFKIFIPIISLLIGGIIIGKKSNKKGWLEGLKLGLIFSVILILFNYLGLKNSFQIKYLLFYFILIISSIAGSMIGINKKKTT